VEGQILQRVGKDSLELVVSLYNPFVVYAAMDEDSFFGGERAIRFVQLE
jgi:hypothetical protein